MKSSSNFSLSQVSCVVALGDSITAARNAYASHTRCEAASWASGTLSYSLASRLAVPGYNGAFWRSRARTLFLQVNPQDVAPNSLFTILIGSNDLLTFFPATRRSFRKSIQRTLRRISKVSGAHVVVLSLPNSQWLVDNLSERPFRALLSREIVRALLHTFRSTRYNEKLITKYNRVLQEVCAEFDFAYFDDSLMLTNHHIITDEVSTYDYLHPSVLGQYSLSKIAWEILLAHADDKEKFLEI